MISPISVAFYFLKLSWNENILMNHLKLQKLIYFAHGWNLALLNKPMMNEVVVVWKYSPIFQSVFNCFKIFGNDLISLREYEKAVENSYIRNEFERLSYERHFDQIRIIETVWEVYKKIDNVKLMEIMHRENNPYKITIEKYKKENNVEKIPIGLNIPDIEIKKYYKNKINK